jgi:hypothetical protein
MHLRVKNSLSLRAERGNRERGYTVLKERNSICIIKKITRYEKTPLLIAFTHRI